MEAEGNNSGGLGEAYRGERCLGWILKDIGLCWLKMAFQLGHGGDTENSQVCHDLEYDSFGWEDDMLNHGSRVLMLKCLDRQAKEFRLHSQGKRKPSELRSKAMGYSDLPIRKMSPGQNGE